MSALSVSGRNFRSFVRSALAYATCFVDIGVVPRVVCSIILLGGGMVKLKVGISFKWLSVIFFHSYVRSIAPKMTISGSNASLLVGGLLLSSDISL